MLSRRAVLGAATAVPAALALPTARAGAHRGAPWQRLRRHLRGDLVLPGDTGYDTARQLDLAQFDGIAPQGVAYCAGPGDAALCLAFAQDHRLPLAVRSGGHSAGGYSTTTGLVVDVSRLNRISVDGRTATLGAGAQNVDVLTALAPHGLAVVGGACPTVAAGGFLQGGGLGFLTPRYGMACDALESAEVVLADGRTVTASTAEHPELYWALRGGGGGNFGVVTSFTLRPSALTQVSTARLGYAYRDALDMLDGYAHWLVDAPRDIGGAAIVDLADAAPGIPPVPSIVLVSTGGPEQLAKEIDRLVSATGAPASRDLATLPYRDLMLGVYGCAAGPVEECHRTGTSPQGRLPRTAFAVERSRLFRDPMPRDGWARLLALFDAGRTAGHSHQLQVLPLGGAVRDLGRDDTAFVHRDSRFTVNVQAFVRRGPVSREQEDTMRHWADAGFSVIDPHSARETYQNFVDPALRDWRRSYYAENLPRLVRVKQGYDPHRVFTFAQGIG
ncbi:FAD-binding oxidoreductase [Streptomyces huiliensis]|uniref:FAD-binding oxidoreductase n=1 Tax=Streptomyces huiliensis TaxID=2876027 RepID=UPI001CC1831E|nr:FAD-binding oxidoreductase [Streptomyces huiliensis]MBZ4322249.1 FAD-binding oxidoreductase [Streptomyces huiliensis]